MACCCLGWLAGKRTELKCIDGAGASAMMTCPKSMGFVAIWDSMKELLSHSEFGSSKMFLSGSETLFLAISFSFMGNPFSEGICFSIMRRHWFSEEFLKVGK